MRRHAALSLSSAAAAVLAAATLLSACGTGSPQSLVLTTGARSLPASFVRQAKEVIGRWDRSRAARVWNTGLVLTGQGLLVQIPQNAGFDSQRQKDMFWSGHFRLATSLPVGSPGDVVRWASGATLRIPVQDARAAFAELSTQTPCGGPYRCSSLGDLSVTSMRPATAALSTSRGLAEVPAWQFRVAQLSWAFTQVAVVRGAVLVLPADFRAEVAELLSVSKNGRVLTLTTMTGYCTGQPKPRVTGQVYETAGVVVVGARVTSAPLRGGVCAGVGLTAQFSATLARPLGSRVVLDVGSGQPLALGSVP
jgi:hypothetical protein